MEHRSDGCSGPACVLAFLGGAVVGAVVGLLLAPKSGADVRREIKECADKTEDDILRKAEETRAALDKAIERGRQFIIEKKADVEAAVKAGREAMKERAAQRGNEE